MVSTRRSTPAGRTRAKDSARRRTLDPNFLSPKQVDETNRERNTKMSSGGKKRRKSTGSASKKKAKEEAEESEEEEEEEPKKASKKVRISEPSEKKGKAGKTTVARKTPAKPRRSDDADAKKESDIDERTGLSMTPGAIRAREYRAQKKAEREKLAAEEMKASKGASAKKANVILEYDAKEGGYTPVYIPDSPRANTTATPAKKAKAAATKATPAKKTKATAPAKPSGGSGGKSKTKAERLADAKEKAKKWAEERKEKKAEKQASTSAATVTAIKSPAPAAAASAAKSPPGVPTPTSSGKKRGRPKGSRNKPKPDKLAKTTATASAPMKSPPIASAAAPVPPVPTSVAYASALQQQQQQQAVHPHAALKVTEHRARDRAQIAEWTRAVEHAKLEAQRHPDWIAGGRPNGGTGPTGTGSQPTTVAATMQTGTTAGLPYGGYSWAAGSSPPPAAPAAVAPGQVGYYPPPPAAATGVPTGRMQQQQKKQTQLKPAQPKPIVPVKISPKPHSTAKATASTAEVPPEVIAVLGMGSPIFGKHVTSTGKPLCMTPKAIKRRERNARKKLEEQQGLKPSGAPAGAAPVRVAPAGAARGGLISPKPVVKKVAAAAPTASAKKMPAAASAAAAPATKEPETKKRTTLTRAQIDAEAAALAEAEAEEARQHAAVKVEDGTGKTGLVGNIIASVKGISASAAAALFAFASNSAYLTMAVVVGVIFYGLIGYRIWGGAWADSMDSPDAMVFADLSLSALLIGLATYSAWVANEVDSPKAKIGFPVLLGCILWLLSYLGGVAGMARVISHVFF